MTEDGGRSVGWTERRSGQTNEQSSTDKLFADSIYVYTPRSVQARPEAKTHAAAAVLPTADGGEKEIGEGSLVGWEKKERRGDRANDQRGGGRLVVVVASKMERNSIFPQEEGRD